MSRFIKEEYQNLLHYLCSYDATKYIKSAEIQAVLPGLHKKALSLLAWKIELTKNSIQNQTYLDEAISDVVQVFPLLVQGYYKAAFCLMRSGVENSYKFFWEQLGATQLSDFKSVDRLFDATKDLDKVKNDEFLSQNFGSLRQIYSELCLYVHSSGEDYCAFEDALAVFPKLDNTQLQITSKYLENFVRLVNNILCYCYPGLYYSMHFVNFETVSANLHKDTKLTLQRFRG